MSAPSATFLMTAVARRRRSGRTPSMKTQYHFLRLAAAAAALTLSQPAQAAAWTTTHPMSTARDYHTATVLPNGGVLVVGGRDGAGPLSTAQIYDPATGAWTPAGTLNHARYFHTATLLPDGKVLVAAGYNGTFVNGIFSGGSSLSSAELYDPLLGTWALTGSLKSARTWPTATLLTNGLVLITGGAPDADTPLSSAELYNPATGTWSNTGPMKSRRLLHSATLLPNGNVLVAGGADVGFPYSLLSSAEIYDPLTGTWNWTGAMRTPRFHFTATLLPDGRVLVAAGQTIGYGPVSGAELFNPATGLWVPTSALTPRYLHTATLLPDGKVLIVGGEDDNGDATAGAQVYDPTAGVWASAGSMNTARAHHLANLLPDGNVLVTGGTTGQGTPVASAERYDSTRGTSSPPIVTCVTSVASDGCQMAFTGTIGALFTVSATTNIALPASSWTVLGVGMELPPGRYRFTDTQATNFTLRFYRARSP